MEVTQRVPPTCTTKTSRTRHHWTGNGWKFWFAPHSTLESGWYNHGSRQRGSSSWHLGTETRHQDWSGRIHRAVDPLEIDNFPKIWCCRH